MSSWLLHGIRVRRCPDVSRHRPYDVCGGAARTRAVVLLACALDLNGADGSTLGTIAVPLELQLHISTTQIGLLPTAVSAVGMVVTLGCGAA
jgi:hypothetical protein